MTLTFTDPAGLIPIHRGQAISPFARDILLIECHVAGTTHVPIKEIEPDLQVGDRLTLRREPLNEHDPLAIQVIDAKDRRVGYVGRLHNEAPARLLDAGKPLFASIVSREWKESWLKLGIQIFLRDL